MRSESKKKLEKIIFRGLLSINYNISVKGVITPQTMDITYSYQLSLIIYHTCYNRRLNHEYREQEKEARRI